MSERYPIKLNKVFKTEDGNVTHARTFRGAEGWELWGEAPGGGEIHLDTRYYRWGNECPQEWQG